MLHNDTMVHQKYFWILFWGICALIAIVTSWRLWNLRLLYLDADIREQTKVTMETIAEQENWLQFFGKREKCK